MYHALRPHTLPNSPTAGCNIFAQQLATSDHVGYMVVDVNTAASETSMETIRSLEENIRTRVLW